MFNTIKKIFGSNKSIKANIEIYTWQTCPYCIKAKLLLWWKNCEFQEYKIDGDDNARELMIQRANGRKTVPQIFINNQAIGGCNDLYDLEGRNQLDSLLSESSSS